MKDNPFKTPIKPRCLGYILERMLGLHTLSGFYEDKPDFTPTSEVQDFLAYALNCMEVSIDLHSSCSLDVIPKSGPVIIVANHPLGGLEGMAMTQQILAVRPDLKVLTNKILTQIPELAETFIGVNVLGKNAARENAKGIKTSCDHLRDGGALLIYPAGVVSAYNPDSGKVEDQPWNRVVGMLARRTKAAVLPCFVDAKNSTLFNYAGLIHPRLRTVMLLREMLNKTGKTFYWHTGELIEAPELAQFDTDEAVRDYLRISCDALSNRNQKSSVGPESTLSTLATPPSESRAASLQSRLESLEAYKLVTHRNMSTYCAPYDALGELFDELAWARERTFRSVGEGSGNSVDTDKYDAHYLHLFVWDHEKSKMVGGYRLGRVDEIVKNHGLDGLYSRSLYQFDEQYVQTLGACLEVGRSFVSIEYQRHPRALDMLWQGIGRYLAENPEYHTLFGCVSISKEYSNLARAFLSESMMTNFKAEQSYLNDIKPIKPLKVKGKLWNAKILASLSDISVINKLVGRFDSGKSVPVLLRHYLALNGRFVCFGLNESFQSSLDGLIMVDLRETPAKYLNRYLGKQGAARFLSVWECDDVVA